MMGFKDFVPAQIERGGFFSSAQYAPFSAAVEEANRWIAETGVEVFNIETVLLPEIWSSAEEGTEDASLRTSGEMGSYWHQIVRVWYRLEGQASLSATVSADLLDSSEVDGRD